ncbi:MAG: VOC family protein [Acidobacteria bacterium]|nr:MAG: VOC family protein [Acidobacteriota bacterium]REK03350.1 MAG: VOC family protein [Acidobacteriota bacterium]
MKPRLSVITLGVDDLEASLRFYRDGLGFATDGILGENFEYGAVVVFDLQPGLRLALWPRTSIAHDTGLGGVDPRGDAGDRADRGDRGGAGRAAGALELTLGHNVRSREEVDAAMDRAARAGARIVKPAHDAFWGGYSGYFQDPDGHLWEVVWNPEWMPEE